MAILFQTIIPESHQNNVLSINKLVHDVHVVNVGRAKTMDLILCFVQNDTFTLPFMQATTDVVYLSSVFSLTL